MRILANPPHETKLCHARPGDVVQQANGRRLYMVCVRNPGPPTPSHLYASNGLYNESGTLFLVGLDNGIEYPMPHLSTRLAVRDDVVIVAPADLV